MSGIAGIFYLDGRPVEREILTAMTSVVAYRGPDGVGHWLEDSVGLGHLQLRTTPESRQEHQPVSIDGGRYVITCDGRVDNREELIQALHAKVPVSVDTPDAELILHAYITWGTACLKRIFGDFAFVIWDATRQELFGARDRLGLRPFNYYYDGRRFLFGSDIGSLLQHHEVPRKLNEVMVGFYLTGRSGDGEQTFYKGIHQLPQGCFLRVTREGMTRHLYWELEADNPILLASEAEYVDQFRHLFQKAVRCRLRNVGPVAVALSGGLDSGSIICAAQTMIDEGQVPGCRLEAFSSVFKEFDSADESGYIREMSQRYQFQAHTIDSDDYWSFKPLQGTYPFPDHPFPIPHQARHEALFQQIQSAGIRVVLNGEGGDEILRVRPDSYFWHLWMNHQWATMRRELRRVTPQWRRYFYEQVLLSLTPGWMQVPYRGVRPLIAVLLHRRNRAIGGRRDGEKLEDANDYSIINTEFAKRIGLDEQVNKRLTPKMFKSPYWRDQHATVSSFGKTFFLSYYSQIALWQGVEARYPFLDARLVDFVCRVPPEQKVFRQNWTKWLLRQAMQGILPEPVRQRPDKGDFSPLFFRGLEELGSSGFDYYVQNGYLTRLGLVDRGRLARLFSAASNGGRYPVMRFISFFSLEAWLRQFLEGGGSGISGISVLPILTKKGGEKDD